MLWMCVFMCTMYFVVFYLFCSTIHTSLYVLIPFLKKSFSLIGCSSLRMELKSSYENSRKRVSTYNDIDC